MVLERLRTALRRLGPILGAPAEADACLLERFVTARDEAAFEALVYRHQGLVMGVCRRVTGDRHTAEDAFQAAFLILARKAGSVGRREALGGWLYRVAYRCALEARRHAARVPAKVPEEYLLAISAPAPSGQAEWEELGVVLDEEVARLPAKYRLPVVLCYLGGQTYDDAARQLRVPKGTLSTRLTRARELLRQRLLARGVSPALGLLTVAAPQVVSDGVILRSIQAGLSPESITPRVSALAEGVLNAMFLNRMMKAVAIGLLLVAFATGVGLFAQASRPQSVLPALAPRFAADAPNQAPAELWWLMAIDREGGTVKLESCDPKSLKPYAPGAAPPAEVRVAAGATILIDGKPAKFQSLIPGIPVRVKFDSFSGTGFGKIKMGEGTAMHVETVAERSLDGGIVATGAGSITVDAENGRSTYRTSGDTPVDIDGRAAKRSDLRPGMSVSLRLSAAYPEVLGIKAVGPSVEGVVTEVNRAADTLSLLLTRPRIVVTELAVTAGTKVTVGGQRTKFDDVKAGMRVNVQFAADPAARRLLTVRADAPGK